MIYLNYMACVNRSIASALKPTYEVGRCDGESIARQRRCQFLHSRGCGRRGGAVASLVCADTIAMVAWRVRLLRWSLMIPPQDGIFGEIYSKSRL